MSRDLGTGVPGRGRAPGCRDGQAAQHCAYAARDRRHSSPDADAPRRSRASGSIESLVSSPLSAAAEGRIETSESFGCGASARAKGCGCGASRQVARWLDGRPGRAAGRHTHAPLDPPLRKSKFCSRTPRLPAISNVDTSRPADAACQPLLPFMPEVDVKKLSPLQNGALGAIAGTIEVRY